MKIHYFSLDNIYTQRLVERLEREDHETYYYRSFETRLVGKNAYNILTKTIKDLRFLSFDRSNDKNRKSLIVFVNRS
jgi:hypothetical protein